MRRRHYLVEEVVAGGAGEATRVELVCLDDDAPGRALTVFWELELGARVLRPELEGLGPILRLDPARRFAAYLHVLRWQQVSATRVDRFQAPFRAGIQLLPHQLAPLQRALALPRANLFIADDVGLGKTIEAGLVLTELALRQRVRFVLVVCPAALLLQWQDELWRRFGHRFEIVNRDFVARRRRERGFGVNPWATHDHFLVSYQVLRRPEYREPLLVRLGARCPQSLLVLDEAHTVAPAAGHRYAVDSQLTALVRESLAPRFEHRLFLSATPHNGYSNSFSALLAMLDPQRFTRGVPIQAASSALRAVLVRRTKLELQAVGVGDFPSRRLVRLEIPGTDVELELARLLAEYTREVAPDSHRGRLVLVNLQKRLLSSVAAFRRTLRVHEGPRPKGRAGELFTQMLALADAHHDGVDAKAAALLAWIGEHQLRDPNIWGERRVIVFTEYAATLRYLERTLLRALAGTERGAERLTLLHGGLGDAGRTSVQLAFTGDPQLHPTRILLATDAAREGLNLQSRCADLFHYDVPWNPARLEQRNGRIDRTLQPASEVRCHYFVRAGRAEDQVLERLVQKVETIRHELGSPGEVLLERLEATLVRGIDGDTWSRLAADEAALAQSGATEVVARELTSQRPEAASLQTELAAATALLEASRREHAFDPEVLRRVLDVGLELLGAGPLRPGPELEGQPAYLLPELPTSWAGTLDSLRRPRRQDEPEWQWQRESLLPLVFRPLGRLGESWVHLHLGHPFVTRVLERLLAQGFGAHDLSRVTVLPAAERSRVGALALGRVSLFGPGGARLHDELVAVCAEQAETGWEGVAAADERWFTHLEAALSHDAAHDPAAELQVLPRAAADFAELWPHVRQLAAERAARACALLEERGAAEARALIAILEAQREAIARELGRHPEVAAELTGAPFADERAQLAAEREHLRQRQQGLQQELATEPEQLRAQYRVGATRVAPVGLVVLWPGAGA